MRGIGGRQSRARQWPIAGREAASRVAWMARAAFAVRARAQPRAMWPETPSRVPHLGSPERRSVGPPRVAAFGGGSRPPRHCPAPPWSGGRHLRTHVGAYYIWRTHYKVFASGRRLERTIEQHPDAKIVRDRLESVSAHAPHRTIRRRAQPGSPCPRPGNGRCPQRRNTARRARCGTCGPSVGLAANRTSSSPSTNTSAERPGVRGKASAAASDTGGGVRSISGAGSAGRSASRSGRWSFAFR